VNIVIIKVYLFVNFVDVLNKQFFQDSQKLDERFIHKFHILRLLYYFDLSLQKDKPMFYDLPSDNYHNNYHQAFLQQFCYRIQEVILFHHLIHHLEFYELI
jgi:hypothetical protein